MTEHEINFMMKDIIIDVKLFSKRVSGNVIDDNQFIMQQMPNETWRGQKHSGKVMQKKV